MKNIDPAIEKLFLKGFSCVQIAEKTNLDQNIIRKQVHKIIRTLETSIIIDQNKYIALELGRINCLENEYWNLLEISKNTDKNDLKLLQGIERCIEIRSQLLSNVTREKIPEHQKNIKIDVSKLSDRTLMELAEIYHYSGQDNNHSSDAPSRFNIPFTDAVPDAYPDPL